MGLNAFNNSLAKPSGLVLASLMALGSSQAFAKESSEIIIDTQDKTTSSLAGCFKAYSAGDLESVDELMSCYNLVDNNSAIKYNEQKIAKVQRFIKANINLNNYDQIKAALGINYSYYQIDANIQDFTKQIEIFQSDNGLKIDGLIGKNTLKAINTAEVSQDWVVKIETNQNRTISDTTDAESIIKLEKSIDDPVKNTSTIKEECKSFPSWNSLSYNCEKKLDKELGKLNKLLSKVNKGASENPEYFPEALTTNQIEDIKASFLEELLNPSELLSEIQGKINGGNVKTISGKAIQTASASLQSGGLNYNITGANYFGTKEDLHSDNPKQKFVVYTRWVEEMINMKIISYYQNLGANPESIKALLDGKIQKVIDNKYGTKGEINRPVEEQKHTGRGASIKNFFKIFFPKKITEITDNNQIASTGDSPLTETQKAEVIFLLTTKYNKTLADVYEMLGIHDDDYIKSNYDVFDDSKDAYAGEVDQGKYNKITKKIKIESQTNFLAIALELGVVTDIYEIQGKTDYNGATSNSIESATADQEGHQTNVGIDFTSNLKRDDVPENYEVVEVEETTEAHFDGVITSTVDIDVPNTCIASGGSCVSSDHFFAMLGAVGIVMTDYGDLEKYCDENGNYSVMEGVEFYQGDAKITVTTNAEGDLVIIKTTKTTTTIHKFEEIKKKTGIMISLSHNSSYNLSEIETELFTMGISHSTITNETHGKIAFGEIIKIFEWLKIKPVGELNDEGKVKAVFGLIFGKNNNVSINFGTDGILSFAIKLGSIELGDNKKINLSVGGVIINGLKDALSSGRVMATLNDIDGGFTNEKAQEKLDEAIKNILLDGNLTSEKNSEYRQLCEDLGKTYSYEDFEKYFINYAITKAGTQLQSDISIAPLLSIPTNSNYLDHLTSSFSNFFKGAFGISLTNEYFQREFKGSFERSGEVNYVGNISSDSRNIDILGTKTQVAEITNVPTKDIKVFAEVSPRYYNEITGLEIFSLKNPDLFISGAHIESNSVIKQASVIYSVETKLQNKGLNDLGLKPEHRLEIEQFNQTIDLSGMTKDTSLIDYIFSQYQENLRVLTCVAAGLLHKDCLISTDRLDKLTTNEKEKVVASMSLSILQNMEDRWENKTFSGPNLGKELLRKFSESKEAREQFKTFSGIDTDDLVALEAEYINKVKSTNGEVEEFVSSGYTMIFMVGLDGKVDTLALTPGTSFKTFGIVKDGNGNMIFGNYGCKGNTGFAVEFKNQYELSEFMMKVNQEITKKGFGMGATLTGLLPTIGESTAQTVKITQAEYTKHISYSDTQELTVSGGNTTGTANIFRPLAADENPEGLYGQVGADYTHNSDNVSPDAVSAIQDVSNIYYQQNPGELNSAQNSVDSHINYTADDLENTANSMVTQGIEDAQAYVSNELGRIVGSNETVVTWNITEPNMNGLPTYNGTFHTDIPDVDPFECNTCEPDEEPEVDSTPVVVEDDSDNQPGGGGTPDSQGGGRD